MNRPLPRLAARSIVALLALAVIASCGAMPIEADGTSDGTADGSLADGSIASDSIDTDSLPAPPDTGPPVDPVETPLPLAPVRYAREYLFTLAHQAFPQSGHPGALVHIPPGFDANQPFGAVVYFHGFKNCIANCVAATGTACTPGAAPRSAYNLIAQFDVARVQALLILPEVLYDQSSGDPGALGIANGFRDFLEEILSVSLAPTLGVHHVTELGRVAIVSHSGGYWATALCATVGGVPQVREIDLLDSLYGEIPDYQRFVMSHLAALAPDGTQPGSYRFESVYTDGGGTAVNNMMLAMQTSMWAATAGVSSEFYWDDSHTVAPVGAIAHPLFFKRTALAHDAIPAVMFEGFVAASGFVPLDALPPTRSP